MIVVGYRLSAPDNDNYMLRGESDPRCDLCGRILVKTQLDLAFAGPISSLPDASYTYDGYLIASRHLAQGLRRFGAILSAIGRTDQNYAVSSAERVAFDSERRRTRFEDYCERCRRFYSVTGAIPVFLKDPARALPDRIVATDIEFGSGDEQHSLLLVGPNAGRELIELNASGLELDPITHA